MDENNVIYWVNYDSNEELFFVMRTLPNEQTVKLNISYSEEIDLTSDTLNFYVLDNGNNVIDQYSKTSFQKLANITHSSSIHDLVIAYGKFNHSKKKKQCCLETVGKLPFIAKSQQYYSLSNFKGYLQVCGKQFFFFIERFFGFQDILIQTINQEADHILYYSFLYACHTQHHVTTKLCLAIYF